MAKWSLDLREYARKRQVEIKEVRKTYAYALYSSIVRKTPVDTGRARGNWNVSVGSPDTSVTEKTRKTPKPISSMPDPQGDESIFIANNLEYIGVLEYGRYPNPVKKGTKVSRKGEKPAKYQIRSQNGYSRQAPEGMVGVTLANNENIFNAAVDAVKGKSK